jgi:predicted transcriptional regulator
MNLLNNSVERYLNLKTDSLVKLFKDMDETIKLDPLIEYQSLYKQYETDPETVKTIIKKKIDENFSEMTKKIFIEKADVNYIISKLYFYEDIKFRDKLKNISIDTLIIMMDYNLDVKENYNYLKKYYYSLLSGLINCNIYEFLVHQLDKITIDNFVKLTKIITKISYNDININSYKSFVNDKFDDIELVKKVINFIKENIIDIKDTELEDNKYKNFTELIHKYDIRFIVDNMKSNAYLLFEEYYKYVKTRYINYKGPITTFPIKELKNEIKLVKYFMFLISIKDKTNINRYVNEILLRIKSYLYDIEDSYNNNYSYYKIKIVGCSEKYKNANLALYKRDISTFQIIKYNFAPDNFLTSSHISDNLKPYIDMYKSFYSARYPDRDFEVDFIKSNLITKITCLSKDYYIHLALIQYVVLDIIVNSTEGICAKEISAALNIKLSLLNEAFNSLLKIKIIMRNSENKFVFNNEFTYDKSKISIFGLIKKYDDEESAKSAEREFMHDRSVILLCNLVNYAKRNEPFTIDFVNEKLSIKVPFKFTKENLEAALKDAIKDNYISEMKEGSAESPILYRYEELE